MELDHRVGDRSVVGVLASSLLERQLFPEISGYTRRIFSARMRVSAFRLAKVSFQPLELNPFLFVLYFVLNTFAFIHFFLLGSFSDIVLFFLSHLNDLMSVKCACLTRLPFFPVF